MAKAKTTAFFCKECGYESSKWMGQCPGLQGMEYLVEEPVAKMAQSAGKGRMSAKRGAGMAAAKPALLSEISSGRRKTGSAPALKSWTGYWEMAL